MLRLTRIKKAENAPDENSDDDDEDDDEDDDDDDVGNDYENYGDYENDDNDDDEKMITVVMATARRMMMVTSQPSQTGFQTQKPSEASWQHQAQAVKLLLPAEKHAKVKRHQAQALDHNP